MPPKKRRKRADHPRRPTIVRRDVAPAGEAEDQPLIRELRRALYEDGPLERLHMASQLVHVTEGYAAGTDSTDAA